MAQVIYTDVVVRTDVNYRRTVPVRKFDELPAKFGCGTSEEYFILVLTVNGKETFYGIQERDSLEDLLDQPYSHFIIGNRHFAIADFPRTRAEAEKSWVW